MSDSFQQFLNSWSWKREGRSERERFVNPYTYTFNATTKTVNACKSLTITQGRGNDRTVWDSSIVLSKFFENVPRNIIEGKKCIELGCGCGLVGLTLGALGASVSALTDLADVLPVVEKNIKNNNLHNTCVAKEYKWGGSKQDLGAPFDLICATDIMYLPDEVQPLLTALRDLSHAQTVTYIAWGRNSYADEAFLAEAKKSYNVEKITSEQLDPVYQCSDVSVFRLTSKANNNSNDKNNNNDNNIDTDSSNNNNKARKSKKRKQNNVNSDSNKATDTNKEINDNNNASNDSKNTKRVKQQQSLRISK